MKKGINAINMSMEEQEYQILLKQYADHTISKENYDKMLSYIKKNGVDGLDAVMFQDWEEMEHEFPFSAYRSDVLYKRIAAARNSKPAGKFRMRSLFRWELMASAAALIILLGAGLFFFKYKSSNTGGLYDNDVAPGGNNAKLILAGGRSIDLKRAAQGVLASQDGFRITKAADGKLIYEADSKGRHTGHELNAIETPKGGQYQVVLPDGSKVWLNAMSVLKYPASFGGQFERKVQLSGEAYFEVFKDKQHPFRVVTAKQEVQVLGTHFNVSSYPEDQEDRTTLVEGSVKINNGILLQPGQQAYLNKSGHWQVMEVNSYDLIAWKDGSFVFEDEPLESIMHKIARWYNVDVVFQGETSKEGFSGTISRYEQISKVLKMLELTDLVHFKIQGRTVIVTK